MTRNDRRTARQQTLTRKAARTFKLSTRTGTDAR
jgi:hypothetical protein